MKTRGILYTKPDKTQEIIISRANHDFNSSSDGKVSADGGQNGYFRTAYKQDATFKCIWFEYNNVTHADLYNDWNNKKDKLGLIKLPSKKVKILEEKDWPDTESFEWRKQTAIWGTNGPEGDEPTKYVQLTDCTTDHLTAIINTCWHISNETREIIQSILSDRDNE